MSQISSGESGPHKSVFIRNLRAKDRVQSTFLIKTKDLLYAKDGKPYLSLLLSDSSGDIEGRVWSDAEATSERVCEGQVAAVSGRVHAFQNRLQVVLDNIVGLKHEEASPESFLPTTSLDLDVLYQDLLSIFEKAKNPHVSALSLSLLQDPEIAARYKRCPAAKTIHHAFIGGLLSHSLQLIRLVDAIVPLYDCLDRDVLVFGAAFHDFGKIFELSFDSSFGYTDEGKLVGHITIATILIDRHIRNLPDFPTDLEYHLKHLILSHHGRLEFGSPKRPQTLEAEVLHFLDSMDSKIDGITSFLRADASPSRWSAYHKAYDQYYFKPKPLQ